MAYLHREVPLRFFLLLIHGNLIFNVVVEAVVGRERRRRGGAQALWGCGRARRAGSWCLSSHRRWSGHQSSESASPVHKSMVPTAVHQPSWFATRRLLGVTCTAIDG